MYHSQCAYTNQNSPYSRYLISSTPSANSYLKNYFILYNTILQLVAQKIDMYKTQVFWTHNIHVN